MINNLEIFFNSAPSFEGYAKQYLSYVSNLLQSISTNELQKVVDILESARKNERTIYICGNGGSAATASHFACDLTANTYTEGQKPIRAISLSDNISALSAIGNDLSYEKVFSEQLKRLIKPNDILIVISASGNSENLIHAVKYAKEKSAKTVAIVGFDGGELAKLSDQCVCISTEPKEYGPAEDGHTVICHLIVSYFYQAIRKML